MIPHSVLKPADRPHWVVQYRHPRTGRRAKKSTGEKTRRGAERWAARFLAELAERTDPGGRTRWVEFLARHAELAHPGGAQKTAKLYRTAFNRVGRDLAPTHLQDLTAEALARWSVQMLADGLAPATAKCYLRHLRAALR